MLHYSTSRQAIACRIRHKSQQQQLKNQTQLAKEELFKNYNKQYQISSFTTLKNQLNQSPAELTINIQDLFTKISNHTILKTVLIYVIDTLQYSLNDAKQDVYFSLTSFNLTYAEKLIVEAFIKDNFDTLQILCCHREYNTTTNKKDAAFNIRYCTHTRRSHNLICWIEKYQSLLPTTSTSTKTDEKPTRDELSLQSFELQELACILQTKTVTSQINSIIRSAYFSRLNANTIVGLIKQLTATLKSNQPQLQITSDNLTVSINKCNPDKLLLYIKLTDTDENTEDQMVKYTSTEYCSIIIDPNTGLCSEPQLPEYNKLIQNKCLAALIKQPHLNQRNGLNKLYHNYTNIHDKITPPLQQTGTALLNEFNANTPILCTANHGTIDTTVKLVDGYYTVEYSSSKLDAHEITSLQLAYKNGQWITITPQ